MRSSPASFSRIVLDIWPPALPKSYRVHRVNVKPNVHVVNINIYMIYLSFSPLTANKYAGGTGAV